MRKQGPDVKYTVFIQARERDDARIHEYECGFEIGLTTRQ